MSGAAADAAREAARTKLLQIFRYLKEFNQLRNPVQREVNNQPWTLWLDDLPDHPSIRRGTVRPRDVDSQDPSHLDDDPILTVRRPTLSRAPEPPAALSEWLKPGWTSPDGQPQVEQTRKVSLPDGTTQIVEFSEDPERENLLREYGSVHAAWARKERPARDAMAVFERLYALQARLERESERVELVLGDGLVTWHPPGGDRIHHPILIQSLELVFDPEVPEFTVRELAQPPELFTALFADVAGVQAAALARCRQDLEQVGCHPLGEEDTNAFLRRTVSQLSPHGVFSVHPGSPSRTDAPCVTRAPVMFLRNRNLGFARALDAILGDLQTRKEIPDAFMSIVGIESPRNQVETESGLDDSPNGEDEEVLLSKPANPQQLQIAKRLERHGAVLVQGPPGTGKTHTIANLIGHLLANGKSVLVTSHTAKALKVVRDQVVEPLRPLCVSVVDDSSDQLEAAVDAISDRLSTLNADQLEREANRLHRQRLSMLRQLREARTQLRDARMNEYRPVVVSGMEYDPSQAARRVAEGRRTNDWIPSPVTLGEPLPLTEGEVISLYRTNALLSPQDERELVTKLPDPSSLLSPSEYESLLSERQSLAGTSLNYRPDLWVNPPPGQRAQDLRILLERLQAASEPLSSGEPWRLAAISAGREGPGAERAWRDLIEQINSVNDLATEAELTIMRLGPEILDGLLALEAEPQLQEILSYLRGRGGLSQFALLLHRNWKRLIDSTRVRGTKPSTIEDFEALLVAVRLQNVRNSLRQRWHRQMAPLGAPGGDALGPEPERSCRQFIPEIERCLSWYKETWEPLTEEFAAQGLQWNTLLSEVPIDLSQYGDLLRLHVAVTAYLPPVVDARLSRLRLAEVDRALADVRRTLDLASSEGEGHSAVVADMIEATRQGNPEAYASAFSRLVTVWNKQTDLARRADLLGKLERVAPGWADAIRTRDGVHGLDTPPGDPAEAWIWRQLNDELEKRGRVSLEELQRQISQLTDDLQRITAHLVEQRAWANQVRRTSLPQRQALNGWKELMRRVGRGKGRRAPHFLAEARRLMPRCQSAVPVWIMPLSRVAESLDPVQNRFDVVIIDEASQSDMLALVALYLGKQVVVVGDHEQVSPLAVGLDYVRVKQTIDVHLDGVPNHLLYDGQSSIYDLAKTAYEPVCLVEHFRCVTPIIQFSNHLSYHGKIKPLRDASKVRRLPATIAYRVDGASLSGRVNEKEAVAVASLLLAASEQPEYDNATFGVISLLADEQARRIDQLLQRFMEPADYSRRQIRCGNAADFQGDERDVMFLSMVDVPSGRGPLPLRTEGANQMYKKRYNVAVSRARDQLWVVHSLNPNTDLKGDDIRLRLIKHAQNPLGMDQRIAEGANKAESEFERQVITRLVQAGYEVVPQWEVGSYRIDMVVVDGDNRLAVECDGDRWHTTENLQEDVTRQMILERMGWRFFRIRGSQYFRDPESTMRALFRRLGELGIRPVGHLGVDSQQESGAEELLDRITRRAAEIRREWGEQDVDPSVEVGMAEGPEIGQSDLLEASSTVPRQVDGVASPQRRGHSRKSSRATTQQIWFPVDTPEQQEQPTSPKTCRIGCHVVVRTPDGEEIEFQLAPPGKGDLSHGSISSDSPVGRTVKDKTAGQRVRVFLPGGPEEYEILDVRDPD